MIQGLLKLLFPRRCIFCGKIMDGEDSFACADCEKSLPYLEEPLCREDVGEAKRIYCALLYRETVPKAIGLYKFRDRAGLYGYFAKLMLERMGKELAAEHCDLIVGVPMHRSKQRRRGYNQTYLLAQELGYWLDIPYGEPLKKIRSSRQQHTLRGYQRKTAQLGTYRCESLSGEKVLLIDDVCTTGATMKECARVLRQAGASQVICAAICNTPKDESVMEELPAGINMEQQPLNTEEMSVL